MKTRLIDNGDFITDTQTKSGYRYHSFAVRLVRTSAKDPQLPLF